MLLSFFSWHIAAIFRSSRSENSRNLKGNNFARVSFFSKVTGGRPIKKRLQHSVLKNSSGRLLWKLRGFFTLFWQFFVHIAKKIQIFQERFIFQITGLFLLFMSGFYTVAKTYWWVLKHGKTAIILTKYHASVSIAKIRLFTLFF